MIVYGTHHIRYHKTFSQYVLRRLPVQYNKLYKHKRTTRTFIVIMTIDLVILYGTVFPFFTYGARRILIKRIYSMCLEFVGGLLLLLLLL